MSADPRRPTRVNTSTSTTTRDDASHDGVNDHDLRPVRRTQSILGDEPRNQTGNRKLRVKQEREQEQEQERDRDTDTDTEQTNMAPQVRQRGGVDVHGHGNGSANRTNGSANGSVNTESTPITSAAQERDYKTISPQQSRDAGQTSSSAIHTSSAVQEAAPDEGTTGVMARGRVQKRTSSVGQRGGEPVVNSDEREREEEGGWWTAFWDKWGTVELENKGSVARDHLALERTFLAWLRTSLSFASIGIAITQLFRLNSSLRSETSSSPNNSNPFTLQDHSHMTHLRSLGKPLGATFLGISILMLLIGFHRYFEAQHYVIRGKFPASRGSIVLVSVLAGGLIVASLGVILAVGRGVER